ncbi:MAG: hypothetical protein B7733_25660 [Myxococcales bacterium FL481]|nr:MAG: hypothetical protein B7733_25660 [Myxococcales bacterium FL481]
MSDPNRRKALIRRLLKGIETGDPEAVAVVNEDRYIQHNPQTHEGSEGLAALFARLAKTNPRVNVVRVFSDGDFVFAHTEYDFATRRVGFEVFRFEADRAVEHWDNIQARREPSPSRHGMVDGPVEATDLDQTEANRELVRRLVSEALIGRRFDALSQWVAPNKGLIQHNPELEDGVVAWREALQLTDDPRAVVYQRLHRVLAEGSFVLCVSEGTRGGVHSAFYDLFRVHAGLVTEHWDTIEAVAPRSEWKNNNGKF